MVSPYSPYLDRGIVYTNTLVQLFRHLYSVDSQAQFGVGQQQGRDAPEDHERQLEGAPVKRLRIKGGLGFRGWRRAHQILVDSWLSNMAGLPKPTFDFWIML